MFLFSKKARDARRRRLKAIKIRSSASSLDVTISDDEIAAAFAQAKKRKMTRREKEAQLVSFVWGNAPEGNRGTYETVRKNLNMSFLH